MNRSLIYHHQNDDSTYIVERKNSHSNSNCRERVRMCVCERERERMRERERDESKIEKEKKEEWKEISRSRYCRQSALTSMFSLFTCKSRGGGGCHGSDPKTGPGHLWSGWREQAQRIELKERSYERRRSGLERPTLLPHTHTHCSSSSRMRFYSVYRLTDCTLSSFPSPCDHNTRGDYHDDWEN